MTATPVEAQRLVIRGGASVATGYVVRLGARLVFLYIAARLFGAALFGAYSLAIAAVELAVAGAGLGMKRYLFKLLDDRPSGRDAAHVVLDAALLVTAASMAIAAAIVLIVLFLPRTLLAENTALAMVVAAPMIAGQALLDLFLAATRWKHRIRYEVTARSVVEPYAGIAAAVVAYAVGFDRSGLLISYWIGTLSALAYALVGTRRSFGGLGLCRYRPRWKDLRATVRSSALPTATDLVSALFARLDLYLVGMFLGEAPAGIYAVARQVRTPVRQVRQSLDGLLTPILAKTLSARGSEETGIATASAGRLILAVQMPMLLAIVLLGQPLLALFGPDFAAGYWVLVILAAAETIQSAFGVGDLILLYRRAALTLWINSASIAVNIALSALLIPRFGLDGAAVSVLAAVTAASLLRRFLLRTYFGVVVPLWYSAAPVIAAAAAAAAVSLVAMLTNQLSPMVRDAAMLAVALVAYATTLKLWLIASGADLALANLHAE